MNDSVEFGFLRESREIAEKSGIDSLTGIKRTGLDEYLKIIFPEVDDWIHDKRISPLPEGMQCAFRPDYRSEKIKMIVEFDGIQHYSSPVQIEKDVKNTKLYIELGYKVVRIPYFIQLTKTVVNELFGVNLNRELFDESIPSLDVEWSNTPAFLCINGIARMAVEFRRFPSQYKINIEHLKEQDNEKMTCVNLLERLFGQVDPGMEFIKYETILKRI